MRSFLYIFFLFIFYSALIISCKKPYAPPAISVDNKFLVIEGTLVNSKDSPSIFLLSRTIKLTDSTTASYPEPGAKLSVESNNGGTIFNFTEQPGGVYKAGPFVLNIANKYRLKIITSSGDQYMSDYVEVKQAPPIDSLTWQQQNDVSIFLNAHDPLNNTRYYKWDYTETYQYEAPLQAAVSQNNGVLYYVDSTNQTFDCWRNVNSTNILVGTSIALGQDVINKAPIAIVPQNSQKITIRYSILVKQYALTEQGYHYLQILKKNTENLGTIFDAQPTQLTGNIYCINDPAKLAIGFFSASSFQQKRLFITKYDVTNWHFIDTNRVCDVIAIGHYPAPDPRFFIYDYPDPDYYPYYFCGNTCLNITRRECVDCRLRGGTNKKPAFW